MSRRSNYKHTDVISVGNTEGKQKLTTDIMHEAVGRVIYSPTIEDHRKTCRYQAQLTASTIGINSSFFPRSSLYVFFWNS